MNIVDLRPKHVYAARRELARRSLVDFACMVDIPTVPLSEAEDEDRFSVMRLGSLVAHHRVGGSASSGLLISSMLRCNS